MNHPFKESRAEIDFTLFTGHSGWNADENMFFDESSVMTIQSEKV